MIRVGLIGAGRWAGVHRDALRTLDEAGGVAGERVELAAVAVASESSAERVRDEWEVPAHTDLAAFLGEELDAAIVASPNYLHAEHGARALDAGLHVLVEKPMAIDLAGCDRLLAAAERADRVLAIGLEMRVFTLFERVRELLDDGAIGAPLHADLRLFRRPYRGGSGGWKSDPAKLGSSVLEEPIHYLDLARWYFAPSAGEPVELEAWANSRAGQEGLHENLDVRLGFAGGERASVTRTIAGWGHHVALDLVGETGALRARWEGAMDTDPDPAVSLTLHRGDGRDAAEAERIDVPARTGHAWDVPRQTRAFLRAVRGEGEVPADGRDGRAAVALSLTVERSLEVGDAVEL